jgi:hypothetical protein
MLKMQFTGLRGLVVKAPSLADLARQNGPRIRRNSSSHLPNRRAARPFMPKKCTSVRRGRKRCDVLYGYIENNARSIPDYVSRHRAGRPVSTSRAEGCVDDLTNARMGKKRRKRWSPRGAHRVAITRAAVRDGRLQVSHRRIAA